MVFVQDRVTRFFRFCTRSWTKQHLEKNNTRFMIDGRRIAEKEEKKEDENEWQIWNIFNKWPIS